jgi:hypothetical protein
MGPSPSFSLTGNAAVVLGTSDYNQKITVLLEDKAYKNLKKDPTDSMECNSVLLKSPQFLRRLASNYDHRVPGPLDSMS